MAKKKDYEIEMKENYYKICNIYCNIALHNVINNCEFTSLTFPVHPFWYQKVQVQYPLDPFPFGLKF